MKQDINPLPVKYPYLEPLTKGSSFKQIFDLLYTLSLLRYANKTQLNQVNSKIATKKKLSALLQAEYLKLTDTGYFFTGRKSLELLKDERYRTKHLAKNLTGQAEHHQQALTNTLLSIFQEPNFYTVFYPHFDYIIPDACLLYRKEEKYKIVFLEVEATEKPQGYLEHKKHLYNRLAKDISVYRKWWAYHSKQVGLPYCKQEDFCFSVRVV